MTTFTFVSYIKYVFEATSFQNTLRISTFKSTGKAVPLQAWNGPEGSRKLRFTDFMTTVLEGGKVVSLMDWSHLAPGNSPGTHFY